MSSSCPRQTPISWVCLKRKCDSQLCLEILRLKTQLAKTFGPCQRADLHDQRKKRITMGKRSRKKINWQPLEMGMPSASQEAKRKNIDFATGRNTKLEEREHKVQAENSKEHAPSDTNLLLKGQTSNEGQRDDSQDFREKALSQDSSVPDSSLDPPHLFERVQKLEVDARNKRDLFFNTRKECESITKEIIRLKKERAALKKEYKPRITEMKKLKSKIEKQEHKREELTLQLNKIISEYTANIIEINHKSDQSELLHEGIKKEYEIKESILEYLEDEMEKKRMQQVNFMSKLEEIKKSQEKINKSEEDKIRDKEILCKEKLIARLERMKSTLDEAIFHIGNVIKECKKDAKVYKNHLQPIIKIAKNNLPAKSNIKEKDRIIMLLQEVCESQKEYSKKRNDIDEKSKLLLDSRVKEITRKIEDIKKVEDNIDYHGNYNNYDTIYLKDQIETIKNYCNKGNNTMKDDIKELDSKYKKIQNSMCNIEELKEDNRIAERDISQDQLDYRLYLMERQQIITNFCLKDESFCQDKEINIQNPGLAKEERDEVLRRMGILRGIIEKIDEEMPNQTKTLSQASYNIKKLQENMLLASRSGIKKMKEVKEKWDKSYKCRDKILEEQSQIAARKLEI